MSFVDNLICSRLFNLLPDFIRWLWSPISKRQHFLRLRDVYLTLGMSEFSAYAEVYGSQLALRRYFKTIGAAARTTRS